MYNNISHLGIIMDGNRRWAKSNKMESVLMGHEKGANKLIDVCRWCKNNGIKYLSVYAFSTENWQRSDNEVNGLFKIMHRMIRDKLDEVMSESVKVVISGNRELISKDNLEVIEAMERKTSVNTAITLNIAFSYGGRDEIVRGVKALVNDVNAGTVSADAIDEALFQKYLDTRDYPDIDLVIRTGGRHRLSNFFPWQTVYSELYFVDTLWPDFSYDDFVKALDYYDMVQVNHGK